MIQQKLFSFLFLGLFTSGMVTLLPLPSAFAKTDTEAVGDCPQCRDSDVINQKNQQDLKKVSKKFDPTWSDVPAISGYSNSVSTSKMIAQALKRKMRWTTRSCYKFVKNAMLWANLIKTRPPGRFAREGVKDLQALGFVNLLSIPKYSQRIKSPAAAPKGAILVYSSSADSSGAGRGHTEIKTDTGTKGGYVSDFFNPNSVLQNELAGRSSRRYKLIGVMIKPVGGKL